MSSIYIREKVVKQPSTLVLNNFIFLADAKLDTKKEILLNCGILLFLNTFRLTLPNPQLKILRNNYSKATEKKLETLLFKKTRKPNCINLLIWTKATCFHAFYCFLSFDWTNQILLKKIFLAGNLNLNILCYITQNNFPTKSSKQNLTMQFIMIFF